jgi:hypothetical protein
LTGGPGKSSISMGFGMFYNPIEQLVLEQFSAEPPFGGSNFIPTPFLQAPYVGQNGTISPNPFTGILNPPRGQAIDWSRFAGSIYFGQFPANMRPQYSDQYNLTIKRQLPGDILLQVAYVGSQGHRLLATYEVNPGNPTTCNDLAALGQGCGPLSEDTPYSFTLPPGQVLHLPYVGGSSPGPNTPCALVNPAPACIITGAPVTGTPITLVTH